MNNYKLVHRVWGSSLRSHSDVNANASRLALGARNAPISQLRCYTIFYAPRVLTSEDYEDGHG